MHTISSEARTLQSAHQRRLYSPESKLQIVGACAQSGASVAGIALQHDINANFVRH